MALDQLKALVGPVDEGMIRLVDVYPHDTLAVCVPMAGPCGYAALPGHVHPGYMFIIPFDRSCKLLLGGVILNAPPGRLLALGPDIPHQELPGDGPPRYLAFFVDTAFLEEHLALYAPAKRPPAQGEHYRLPARLMPRLREFMAECRLGVPGSQAMLSALAVEICHLAIRAMLAPNSAVPATGRHMRRSSTHLERHADDKRSDTSWSRYLGQSEGLERALQLIESRYQDNLDLQALARAANMSRSHFGRQFKRCQGVSPMEYLQSVRLDMAKTLLLAPDKSVTQVALECGFANPAHFSVRFAKAFTLPPAEYRQAMTGGALRKDKSALV